MVYRSRVRPFRMYRIYSVLLLTALVAAKSHLNYPLTFDTNSKAIVGNRNVASQNYRLPDYAIPESYTLALTPNLDEKSEKAFTFAGVVNINFQLTSDQQSITIHSRGLELQTEDIKILDAATPTKNYKLSVQFNEDLDFVYLKAVDNATIPKGDYILEIKYTGKLNDDLRGFYRSSYTNDKGEKV